MLQLTDLGPKSLDLWINCCQHFAEQNKESIELIVACRKRGQQREPKQHDIFVHAQFPFSRYARIEALKLEIKKEKYNDHLALYESLIRKAIADSDNPIYINHFDGKENWPKLVIPAGREIFSVPYHAQETGAITQGELENLLDLFQGIHPEDSFRIHGAALGRCLTEFAFQLYGIVYAGQFWPDNPNYQRTETNDDFVASLGIEGVIIINLLIEKSKIRLGVVHDSYGKLDKMLDPKCPKPICIQMIDDKTHIVPYEKEEVMRRISERFVEVSDR